MIVTLQSADNTVTLSSVDLDGDGPNEPVLSVQGLLNANATYTGSVRFLNESVAPLEDITEEVKEEAEEHQVFYSFTAPINSVTTSDNDSNGNPLGLDFTLTTGAAGTAGFGIMAVPNAVIDHARQYALQNFSGERFSDLLRKRTARGYILNCH